MNAVQIRVRTKIHPDELKAKVGKVLDDTDYNVLMTGPTDMYDTEGTLLARYIPGALAPELMDATWGTLHELKQYMTNNRGLASGTPRIGSVAGSRWNYAAQVSSAIVGSFDPKTPKNYCRLTAWSGKEIDKYTGLFPLFESIDRSFAEGVPDRYAAQLAYMKRTHPDWRIGKTAFTTVTVNNSYPTGVHVDKGDLDDGFSTLAVMRKGDFRGGVFVFAEYRVGVNLQHGDLILMDAHQWHGNTAMFCNVCSGRIGPGGRDDHDETCGVERISVVSYYRTRMQACASREEEDAKSIAWADRQADFSAKSNPLLEQMAEETGAV